MLKRLTIIVFLLAALMPTAIQPVQAAYNDGLFRRAACDYGIFFMQKPVMRTEPSANGALSIAEAGLVRLGIQHRFIATCTEMAAPPATATEANLISGLKALARQQGLRIIRVSAEALEGVGWVGRMRARRLEGPHDMAYEIRRFTGPKGYFDIWSGAEARAYPTPDAIGFLLLVYRGDKFVNPGDKHIPECGDGGDGPKARFVN